MPTISGDRWRGDVSNSGSFVRGVADRSLGGYGISSVKSMRESLEAVSRFRSMQVKDALAHGMGDEPGPVDFDVATNSQGMEVKSFTVKTLSQDASHASVVARLAPNNWVRKSERENEIRYDLVWEHGRWKIMASIS